MNVSRFCIIQMGKGLTETKVSVGRYINSLQVSIVESKQMAYPDLDFGFSKIIATVIALL